MTANLGKTARDWIAPLAIILGMVWGGGRLAERIGSVEQTVREGFRVVDDRLSTLDARLWELRGARSAFSAASTVGPTCSPDSPRVYLTPLTMEHPR